MQNEEPWWLVGALGWLAIYDNIAQAQGKVGDNFRPELERRMEKEPPSFLYKFHKKFLLSCEAEANRNA